MVQVLTMPMMGNTMEIGVVVEWLLNEGESVSEGEPVVVVESEKTSSEITADQDGELTSIDVGEGEEVPPGTRLGVILGPDEDASSIEAEIDQSKTESVGTDTAAGSEPQSPEEATMDGADGTKPMSGAPGDGTRRPAAPGARKRARESGVQLETVDGTGPDDAVLIADIEKHLETTAADSRPAVAKNVVASPHVRRLARELGIDLREVDSLAAGDRVTESDVRRAATGQQATAGTRRAETTTSAPEEADPASEGLTVAERRQLTGMRSTIAKRMSQSARQKPHVTLNRTVNAEPALRVVNEYSDAEDGLGLNDLLVSAAAEALEKHPEFNAWFGDGTISLVEEINVGVAVDIGNGLVTPVLRDAASKTPVQLARERAELTQRVQAGEHSLDDIQGGTFTISNLGMFGIDSFDPIINPPQIAILGVGRIRNKGDERELTLSLSFDHRVVDGADAAQFLDTLVSGFTSPTLLLNRRFEASLE